MSDQKFYITKQGLEKIQKEYDKLVEFREAKRKGEFPSIWHSEDVNPDYLSFQEDMSLLDAKLTEYDNIFQNVELIRQPAPKDRDTIGFGAKVQVEIDNGEADEFEIVGTLEANPILGRISNESPVGKALFGLRVGDEVAVSSPKRTMYRIKKIHYTS